MRAPSGSFFGTQVAERHTAGLHLVETLHKPNASVPWHTHQWPYITFVLRGGYTEECEGKTSHIREGDVVLHGAGEAHANRIHDVDSHLLNVEFTQCWLDRISACGATLDSRFIATGVDFRHLGNRLHSELWSEDHISSLSIEALALELTADIARRRSDEPRNRPWLQKATDYLRATFKESPTLAEVAQAVGVHPVHLAREFRRRQGLTVGEYIRRLRVELACHELVTSEQPIVDIAVKAGFCDHSHLTRVFQRHTGLTPTEFRKLRRPS
jgi:AraC family transcriptional regulator